MKVVNTILLGLFVATQYALWVGDKNFFDLFKLQEISNQTTTQNEKLERRNQRLLAEVIDLKEGGETVETIARSELGLIKEGETFYQILEE